MKSRTFLQRGCRALELGEVKAKQFREMVARHRDEQGAPAPEVEFFHHWPKHEHLDSHQLRWYLYWRTLWESGQVQKTSLSYMMIHVYELLSLEYIKDPQKAAERLIKFYTDFHSIQPKLDVTLVRWIGDLYLKLGEIDNALYWYTKGMTGDLYEKLSWYRYGELDIPLCFLQKVAGYQKTQFYRDHKPEIERKMEEMLHSVFRVFYRKEGMHPLDKFARALDEPVVYLFSSTPIHEKMYVEGFKRFEPSGAFVHFVKNCMRYAENVLRRHEGKSRLKCDESVGVYFEDVEPLYPPKVKAEKETKVRKKEDEVASGVQQDVPLMAREMPEELVEIDFSRVQALSEETEWLVDLMGQEQEGAMLELPVRQGYAGPLRTEGGLDGAAEQKEYASSLRANGCIDEAAMQQEDRWTDGSEAQRALQEANPAVTNPPPDSVGKEEASDAAFLGSLFAGPDEGELEEVLDGLGRGERAFLQYAVQSGVTERGALAAWLKQKRMFLDATVMTINDAMLEAGLDPLLDDEGDEVRIAEDYEAAVRTLVQKEEFE